MTKASDNAFPSILVTEGTEPAAPAAGKQRLYIDSTSHHLSRTDSGGTQVDLETNQAAGGVATDAIWDAAGDLAVGSGANTAAKLTKGADSTVLTIDPTTHVPVWATPAGGGISNATTVTKTDSNFTTTSATFVSITGLAATLTTGAHRCLVSVGMYAGNGTAGQSALIGLTIDGTESSPLATQGWAQIVGATNYQTGIQTFLTSVLTAASHTFQVTVKTTGGSTFTLYCNSSNSPAWVTVVETAIAA